MAAVLAGESGENRQDTIIPVPASPYIAYIVTQRFFDRCISSILYTLYLYLSSKQCLHWVEKNPALALLML